jgi:hypothetical protein
MSMAAPPAVTGLIGGKLFSCRPPIRWPFGFE